MKRISALASIILLVAAPVVHAFFGRDKVESLWPEKPVEIDGRATEWSEMPVLEVEGLFVSIGLVAATDFVTGLINTKDGHIITDDQMQTSVEGIFAAGDIRSKRTRQIATAVGDGAMAGMAVTEYLKK